MSLQTDIQKLKSLRAQATAIAEKIEARRNQALAGIHEAHGFESVEEFLAAVRAANAGGGKRRGRPRKAAAAATTPAAKGSRRRRRSKITLEMKDQLKGMVKDGKTGLEIAKKLGISLPSVHNVKKELGLTKSRK